MKKRFRLAKDQHPLSCTLIIASHAPQYQQHDIIYEYEPGAVFRWLTRTEAHPCIIVMLPDGTLHAFLNTHDPVKWLWEGPQVDILHADNIEADHIHPITTFTYWLQRHLPPRSSLLVDPKNTQLQTLIANATHSIKTEIIDINPCIQVLRSQKDSWEIDKIIEALSLTAQSHIDLMRHAHTDAHESAMHLRFLRSGYQQCIKSLAYPPIIATGANAVTLHYQKNNNTPDQQDWILVDAAWRIHGYCSDITRSYPINKKASGLKRTIYQLVLTTQQTIMKHMKPGANWAMLNQLTQTLLASGLIDLGILHDDGSNTIKKYFPHGIGHWLGLEVHDQNPYYDDHKQPIPWTKGMVLTIEPGLYFAADDTSVPKEIRGFGIRIEDNILITESGHQNLSVHIPVELDDIAHV